MTFLPQGPLRSKESLSQTYLLRTMVISEKRVGVVPRDPKGLAMLWSMKLGGHVTWCLGILPLHQRAG